MAFRVRKGRLLIAIALAVLSLPLANPASAVVPSWTTLLRGTLTGYADMPIVVHGGATYVLISEGSSRGHGCHLVSLDGTGTVVWDRLVASGAGIGCDHLVADETGFYMTINVYGDLDGVPAGDGWNAHLRKLTFDGSVVWTRSLAGPDSEQALALAAGGGDVVLGGWWNTGTALSTVTGFVRSYDSDGNVRWTQLIDSDHTDMVTGLATDSDGTYAAVRLGDFDATSIHRFAPDGTPGWTTSLAPGNYVQAIAMVAGDGVVYTVGQTAGAFPGKQNTGGMDAYLAAFDTTTGASTWVRQFGSPAGDFAGDVALGPNGIVIAGSTEGALPRFQNRGLEDAFVRGYTTSGRRLWTRQFGTRASDHAWGVAADAGGATTMGVTWGNLGTGHVADSAVFVRRWGARS
jgi:hypothetical protein